LRNLVPHPVIKHAAALRDKSKGVLKHPVPSVTLTKNYKDTGSEG